MIVNGYVKSTLGLSVRHKPISGMILYFLPWKQTLVIDSVQFVGSGMWGHVRQNEHGPDGWVNMNLVQAAYGDYVSPVPLGQMWTCKHSELPEDVWNKGSFMHYQLLNNPKKGKAHSIKLGAVANKKSWAYYIRSLNTAEAWQWMVDENGTKDVLASSDGGKTITIPCQLLFGNENVVNVWQVKGRYTEIIGLSGYDAKSGFMLGNPPDAGVVNYWTRPDLVHRIYGCNQHGEPFVPIGGEAYMPVINPVRMQGAGTQTRIWIETRFLRAPYRFMSSEG